MKEKRQKILSEKIKFVTLHKIFKSNTKVYLTQRYFLICFSRLVFK